MTPDRLTILINSERAARWATARACPDALARAQGWIDQHDAHEQARDRRRDDAAVFAGEVEREEPT